MRNAGKQEKRLRQHFLFTSLPQSTLFEPFAAFCGHRRLGRMDRTWKPRDSLQSRECDSSISDDLDSPGLSWRSALLAGRGARAAKARPDQTPRASRLIRVDCVGVFDPRRGAELRRVLGREGVGSNGVPCGWRPETFQFCLRWETVERVAQGVEAQAGIPRFGWAEKRAHSDLD